MKEGRRPLSLDGFFPVSFGLCQILPRPPLTTVSNVTQDSVLSCNGAYLVNSGHGWTEPDRRDGLSPVDPEYKTRLSLTSHRVGVRIQSRRATRSTPTPCFTSNIPPPPSPEIESVRDSLCGCSVRVFGGGGGGRGYSSLVPRDVHRVRTHIHIFTSRSPTCANSSSTN